MMVKAYTIEVKNQSSITNTYVVSHEPPQIDETPQKSWPLAIARATAPTESTVKFTINQPAPYYAYAISSQGEPGHSVATETQVKKAVKLGKLLEDGTLIPGSTLQFSFVDGLPNLSIAEHEMDGRSGAFAIQTTLDFTREDISKNNVLIGLGDDRQPWSAFAPEPGMTYFLQPQNIFYLYAVNVQAGSIVDTQTVSNALRLDFTRQPGYNVHAVHGASGELTLEK